MNHIKYEMMCWDEMTPEQPHSFIEYWEVEYHHDIWGNQQDGWTVNDSMRLGTIGIPRYADARDIILMMQEARFLAREFNENDYECIYDDGYIYIDEKDTGRPVFTLHLLD